MCSAELFDTGSHLASSRPRRKKPKSKSQRICLHEMDHWRCSIIGTCLTHDDLPGVARRRDAHVPVELRNRIFGEVHMMSHLMGGSTRKIVGAAAELQARVDDRGSGAEMRRGHLPGDLHQPSGMS